MWFLPISALLSSILYSFSRHLVLVLTTSFIFIPFPHFLCKLVFLFLFTTSFTLSLLSCLYPFSLYSSLIFLAHTTIFFLLCSTTTISLILSFSVYYILSVCIEWRTLTIMLFFPMMDWPSWRSVPSVKI